MVNAKRGTEIKKGCKAFQIFKVLNVALLSPFIKLRYS